jgi:hypothetical protein
MYYEGIEERGIIMMCGKADAAGASSGIDPMTMKGKGKGEAAQAESTPTDTRVKPTPIAKAEGMPIQDIDPDVLKAFYAVMPMLEGAL